MILRNFSLGVEMKNTKLMKYDFGRILENTTKNIPKQCRTVEGMGVQREPKSKPKSLKKDAQNTCSFLWVPLGAQGVPGITF